MVPRSFARFSYEVGVSEFPKCYGPRRDLGRFSARAIDLKVVSDLPTTRPVMHSQTFCSSEQPDAANTMALEQGVG